ncbi:FkbM family methyltransferase [Parafrankia elaeagni]|uniref:FkbM family methyltransferase n=1 Tax=Parafrankia elaeagni TaxID=222534 RepID=UPI0003742DE7|nr:FkbM family methyltransferase [Parafrankia elaeagni]
MKTFLSRNNGPLRWQAAGALQARLPDVRGRDRLIRRVQGSGTHTGSLTGTLHNGLTFSFPDAADGSVRSMLSLCYRPPALAPVLDVALNAGGCFYDVGANIGIYTLWAASKVGPAGQMYAFEPAPATFEHLTRLVRMNGLGNVTAIPAAVGARRGVGYLRTVADASGLAHLTTAPAGLVDCLEAPLTTLDDHVTRHRPPTLIKIDVEGHELAVLQGAGDLLATHRPVVVLEAIPSHQARTGSSTRALFDLLSAADYEVFSLTPRGLAPATEANLTVNVLALARDNHAHSTVAARLAETRFARNQCP